MQEGTVLSDGCEIFYQISGEGEKELLFLHGNGEDMHIFDMIERKLHTRWRICRIDSRCHGRSTGEPNDLSVDKMAEDTICVIKKLKLKKPHLIGFSDGANVALGAMEREPDLIDKLVLVGANLYPRGLTNSAFTAMKIEEKFLKLKKLFGVQNERELALLRLMLKGPKYTAEMLKNIKNDTMVIAGEYDVIRREHTYKIAKSLPNATLRIIPGCDHFLFTRRLGRLLNVLMPFLDEE